MNTQEPGVSGTTTQTKILVVDDDVSIRRALSMVLRDFGNVVTVEGGIEAIELLGKTKFDLILTDYEMPRGNGLEVLNYLEKTQNKTPAIMITAFGTKDLIIETIKHHVFGFIEKPFNKDAVKALVNEALKKKANQDRQDTLARLGAISGELVHEISSPISVLDFRMGVMTKSGNTEGIEKANQAVNKIKDIITSAKDSIRGSTQGHLETSSLQDCFNEAKQEYEIRAQGKSIQIHLEPVPKIDVMGSRTQVGQILVNLINNAIDAVSKYKEKWVKVSVLVEPPLVKILVTDSGPGIPPEVQNKLFQPLFTTKGKNGNGLGLTTVQKIARECGGDVLYNSSCPNTQFVVLLQIAAKRG